MSYLQYIYIYIFLPAIFIWLVTELRHTKIAIQSGRPPKCLWCNINQHTIYLHTSHLSCFKTLLCKIMYRPQHYAIRFMTPNFLSLIISLIKFRIDWCSLICSHIPLCCSYHIKCIIMAFRIDTLQRFRICGHAVNRRLQAISLKLHKHNKCPIHHTIWP